MQLSRQLSPATARQEDKKAQKGRHTVSGPGTSFNLAIADLALLSASSAAAPLRPVGRLSFQRTICTISGDLISSYIYDAFQYPLTSHPVYVCYVKRKTERGR